MNDTANRIATLSNYLKDNAAPSQESTSEQAELLLFLGNVLGLYDAVDYFRRVEESRTATRKETMVERYQRGRALADTAERELEAHYIPRITKTLAEGQVEEARTLFREIPDCVTRVFAMDAFRQAGVSPA